MYIKQISIKNYRNFGNTPFTTELRPFTLIIGENNVGKTNLLNALGLIFSQEIMIFRKRILEIDDFNYSAIESFKNKVKDLTISVDEIEFPFVNIEVILTEMDDDQLAIIGNWFFDQELEEAKITYRFAPRANFNQIEWIEKQREVIKQEKESGSEAHHFIDIPIEEYRYTIFGGDDTSNECNMYYLKMLKMEFLDALRDARKELIASGEYRLLYRILIQKDKDKYADIKSVIKKLDEAVNANPNLLSIKNDVKKLLDKVSLQNEASDNRIDFIFSSPEAHELLKKISLIYGSQPISVERNGLGRNNLLYISLILSHLTGSDSDGGNTFFRLIAIEEPEAHLHPHLQDHIAENIESIQTSSEKAMQLLITTHSTHIAAKMNLDNSVIIYNDSDNKPNNHYILSGIDEVKEKSTIHYLNKFIDATKSRMFFSRKTIFVEGISELLLIPIFFRNSSGKTLEKIGCNIINVNGVAFRHFLKIIRRGFFIKGLVLTDRDYGKKTENRAEKLRMDFDDEDLIRIEISEETTFEKDLIKANKSDKGKVILLNALRKTKPLRGSEYEKEIADNDLDIISFYNEIEQNKSEFAFNLAQELEDLSKKNDFRIPKYIEQGFQFIAN